MANRNLFTVRHFCKRNPGWTEGSVRDAIFNSKPRKTSRGIIPGNGLESAIIRFSPSGTGRGRVLIDEDRWFEIVASHRQEAAAAGDENQLAENQPTHRRSHSPLAGERTPAASKALAAGETNHRVQGGAMS